MALHKEWLNKKMLIMHGFNTIQFCNNAFICGGSNMVVAIALCWTVVLCAIVQTGNIT
jgi:hypothetical protein